MTKQKSKILILFISFLLPFSFVVAGTVLTTHKYAWSDNVGYINFEGVSVNDGGLTGFAWSTNKGFINFNPTIGGVLNDGQGNLTGSAWGEQLGWIDFSGVHIDGNGKFSGTATGTLVGTITFDCPNFCDVETDWRPVPPPTPAPAGGGGVGGGNGPIVGSLGNSNGSGNVVVLLPNTGTVSSGQSSTRSSPPVSDQNQGVSSAAINPVSENPMVGLPSTGQSSVVTSGTPSNENPALFDVVSQPVESTSTKQNVLPFVGSIVVLEILVVLLAVAIVWRVRLYIIERSKGEK